MDGTRANKVVHTARSHPQTSLCIPSNRARQIYRWDHANHPRPSSFQGVFSLLAETGGEGEGGGGAAVEEFNRELISWGFSLLGHFSLD